MTNLLPLILQDCTVPDTALDFTGRVVYVYIIYNIEATQRKAMNFMQTRKRAVVSWILRGSETFSNRRQVTHA
jgi:hypothetical protein